MSREERLFYFIRVCGGRDAVRLWRVKRALPQRATQKQSPFGQHGRANHIVIAPVRSSFQIDAL